MNFLTALLKALIPTLVPTFLNWLTKKGGQWSKDIVNYFKNKWGKKKVKDKKAVREDIVKRIEIATEKGDHEELQKLHIALHVVDTDVSKSDD